MGEFDPDSLASNETSEVKNTGIRRVNGPQAVDKDALTDR